MSEEVKKVPVVLKVDFQTNKKGEVAGFYPALAQRLIGKGLALPYSPKEKFAASVLERTAVTKGLEVELPKKKRGRPPKVKPEPGQSSSDPLD